MSMKLWAVALSLTVTSFACSETVPSNPDQGTVDVPAVEVGVDTSVGPDVPKTPDVQAELPPPADCTAEPGAFGCPCVDNTTCNGGYCVQDANGSVCSKPCIDDCSREGWSCKSVTLGGGDPTFLCMPAFPRLCYPCKSNEDCRADGQGDGTRCVDLGVEGSFCGGDCTTNGCPNGYSCVNAADVNGQLSPQCLPQGGVCECPAPAIADGASTLCRIKNPFGTCEGERLCSADGLSDCSATEPMLEICNGADDNCDGFVDEGFSDADEDGVADCVDPDIDGDGSLNDDDCQPNNPDVSPTATELCNGTDDNCDATIDEPGAIGCVTAYVDADFDGFGAATACICSGQPGYAPQGNDCDDDSFAVNPGQVEVCGDGIDNNCDNQTDNAGSFGCLTRYLDVDGDTYGVTADSQCLCGPEGNYTALQGGDCDDTEGVGLAKYPSNPEVCDLLDNNCNGEIDEGVKTTFFLDDDGDGIGASYASADACNAPAGYVASGGDCNDFNQAIFPGQDESCNAIDDNCNGETDEDLPLVTAYVDLDGDGYGVQNTAGIQTCLLFGTDAPNGYALSSDDCNDTQSVVYPGAPEQCDEILNDCNADVLDYHCPTVCAGDWPVDVASTVGHVMVAQVNASNTLETIVQGAGQLTVINADGSVLWTVAGPTTYSYPTVADISMDGFMDVIEIGNGQIRVFNGPDGTILETHSVPSSGARNGLVFDLDNDGLTDFVTPGTRPHVVLRDGAGGAKDIIELLPPAGTYFNGSVPSLSDVDDDGIAEVIIGTGYFTCNGGTTPACNGMMLIYDPITGMLENDPLTTFLVPDKDNAYAGGPLPFIADVDNDGELDIFHEFGNGVTGTKGLAWRLDGTDTVAINGLGGRPTAAPVDGVGALSDGSLRAINGSAFDLTGDGDYEWIQGTGSGFTIRDNGQVMDGYPVTIASSGGVTVDDIDRDGRTDVVFLGSESGKVHCYTLGEGTFEKKRLLTTGHIDSIGGSKYRTHAYDPYEPNAMEGFDPTTATDPVAQSRAFPLRGFRDLFNSSSGWRLRTRAALGAQGDRDFYWAQGTQFRVRVETLVGPLDVDMRIHMYKDTGGGVYEYITTRSFENVGNEDHSCVASEPCPDASSPGTKLFLIEVFGHDESVDFGPWPYELRSDFGLY